MSIYTDVLDAFRREYLTRVLTEHGGNRATASRALGISREYLQTLIKKHRIDVPSTHGRPRKVTA
ncbi:MAG TPA: helix-turn-helix domain-containing protein [Terriglobales bacterium]|nr:helix-turn-helix domain-containing protein [Terriglobales bacterium]